MLAVVVDLNGVSDLGSHSSKSSVDVLIVCSSDEYSHLAKTTDKLGGFVWSSTEAHITGIALPRYNRK